MEQPTDILLKELGAGACLRDDHGTLSLEVPAGVSLSKPVVLTNLLRDDADLESQQSLCIRLREGSRAQVVVTDRSVTDQPFHSTHDVDVCVDAGAALDLFFTEETTAATIVESRVRAVTAGTLRMGFFSIGSGNATHSVDASFAADDATLHLFGMAVLSGRQQVTNHLDVVHDHRHCTDRELFKYVLDEDAVGRFEGLVRVLPGAAGTDSQQLNRNICLSRSARMYAQPQLIIDHDDVKCSHGATVGQLDENALFYMQQRGISRHEARLLLLASFFDEVISRVTVESLRDRLTLLAESRLRGEMDHCVACGICKNNP